MLSALSNPEDWILRYIIRYFYHYVYLCGLCYILSNWAATVPLYSSLCRNSQNEKLVIVTIDIPNVVTFTAIHLSPHDCFQPSK